MSASAVFDKLCLRSADDLLNLSKLLIEHLKTVVQVIAIHLLEIWFGYEISLLPN